MDSSPIGKLAPELRNSIYELLNDDEEPVVILVADKSPARMTPPRSLPLLALSLTCRELRKECLSMFYSTNTFQLQTFSFDTAQLQRDDEDFFQTDTMKAIIRTKSDQMKQLRAGRKVPGVWSWLRQIGKEYANRIRKIDIVLGKYDYAHPQHVAPAFALRETLAPISSFFENNGAESTLVFSVAMIDGVTGFEHVDFRLPLNDLKIASTTLNTICNNWMPSLKEREIQALYSPTAITLGTFYFKEAWLAAEKLLQGTHVAKEEKVSIFQ